MTIPILRLKRRSPAPRALRGHPWVYAGEVENGLPADRAGEGVALVDARGRALGMGLYNPHSKIVWRRYTTEAGLPWGAEFWTAAIARAAARRQPDESYQRLVWSEADDLPGLVVDRFGEVLVVQALTLGIDRALEGLTSTLCTQWEPREVLFRNDAPSRRLEGLGAEVRTLSGRALEPAWHTIDGVDYWLDLANAQKTGFYLDQRSEHQRIGGLAAGRRVLDVFCNQGAFALQAARGGAESVTAIDISAGAIEQARRNGERAGCAIEWIEANAFDWLTAHAGAQRYGLIILDPPSFAPNRRAVEGALRGYKQLHLRALQMLEPGGVLATYSCSQHIDRETFLENLAEAAADVGRPVRLLELTGQPPDHPVRLGFPESAYLKGAIVLAE